ncbi:hypothetical protein D3C87_1934550 [compost metagenome]
MADRSKRVSRLLQAITVGLLSDPEFRLDEQRQTDVLQEKNTDAGTHWSLEAIACR